MNNRIQFPCGVGGYEKSLTRRFFGLGPNTRERDETSYIDEVIDLGARGEFALPEIAGNWIATIGARGEHHDLAPGRVSGRPTTNQVFPRLFAAANHHDSFTVTTGLRYDTRDSQHQPYSGWQLGVLADSPLWQSSGEVGTVATTFGNLAVRLSPLLHGGGDEREENPPTDTLALSAFVQTSAGELPYYERPSLGGGERLRGYIQHRSRGTRLGMRRPNIASQSSRGDSPSRGPSASCASCSRCSTASAPSRTTWASSRTSAST